MKPATDTLTRPSPRPIASPVIAGIGTALPTLRVTQKEILDFVLKHFDVGDAAAVLYRRTLGHPGIETRNFALSSLEECLDTNPDHVAARFERTATDLAGAALRRAMVNAGIDPATIDFLVVSTCTGYVCPGISAHVLESAGLRSDTRVADLVGMGCGAAIPALEAACNFIAAHPGSTAAAISVEICSAALFSNDEPGIVVSNSLFSDGAAALIVRSDAPISHEIRHPRVRGFASQTRPEWRETLRFKTDGGRLKNILGPDVPKQAALAVSEVSDALLAGRSRGNVSRWIFHAGGAKVLDAIEQRMALPPVALASARDVLRQCGNMSSPTVLFVLNEESRLAAPGELAVMAAFGAGFTAHGVLLEY